MYYFALSQYFVPSNVVLRCPCSKRNSYAFFNVTDEPTRPVSERDWDPEHISLGGNPELRLNDVPFPPGH